MSRHIKFNNYRAVLRMFKSLELYLNSLAIIALVSFLIIILLVFYFLFFGEEGVVNVTNILKGILLVIMMFVSSIAIVASVHKIKRLYVTKKQELVTEYLDRKYKAQRDYVSDFYIKNNIREVDNRTVYVSSDLHGIVYYCDRLFKNVIIDEDRKELSIGFSKKKDLFNEVETFFEYDKT